MKISALLALSLGLSLSLTACDKVVDPVPTKTDSTKTTPTPTPTTSPWTATVDLDPTQLTEEQMTATESIQLIATQSAVPVATKLITNPDVALTLTIPLGDSGTVTANGYNGAGEKIWTGSAKIFKSSPTATIALNPIGGTSTPIDNSAKLYSYSKDADGNALTAGAQAARPGSFISVQDAYILVAGEKTAADEASIDVIFSASTNTASGIPTFFSPATAPNNLSAWTIKNATIIVKTSKASSEITTVNAVKAAMGSATSQSAAAVDGGVYLIKTANGIYGMIEILSLNDLGNASTVTMKIFSEN